MESYDAMKSMIIHKFFPNDEKYKIDEVFKLFRNSVIADARKNIKKGNLNKNEIKNIIATHDATQLIDIRSLYFQEAVNSLDTHFTLISNIDELPEDNNLISCEKIDMICLPFNNNFIQFNSINYCFIREYGDNVYTGTLLYSNNRGEIIGTPFCIKPEYGEYVIKFKNDTLNKDMKECTSIITYMLHMLSKLSLKLHFIYTTDLEKSSRVNTPNDKKGKKPIYIYVSKNQTKVIKYYEKTYKNLKQLKTWLVRGHWRKLQDPTKIGKNPQGNYVVEGFTWVKPSQKGNKNLQVEQNTYVTI